MTLPVVWFYVILVAALWILLVWAERRRRARRKIEGCSELNRVTADRLWARTVRDPDLVIVALIPDPSTASGSPMGLPGAIPVPLHDLHEWLAAEAPGRSYAFYSDKSSGIGWAVVDAAVCAANVRNCYVLDGGLESWSRRKLPLEPIAAAPSLHRPAR